MDIKTLVVVDDHPIFRSGLVQTIELEPHFNVVAQGENGDDAAALAEQHKPDMVLLDVKMEPSGVSAIPSVHAASPGSLIVMLTASDDVLDVSRALELGAVSYVLKGTTGNELLSILTEIFAGQTHISPQLLGDLITHQQGAEPDPEQLALQSLTAQEQKVLRLVTEGMSNSEIAGALAVREKTVKFHLSNVYDKLEVRNRVEAALFAKRLWT